MGTYSVTFDVIEAPIYNDNEKVQNVPCGDDVQPRTVVFNTTGDFVVGLDYVGETAAKLNIISFTDDLYYSDTLGGPLIQNTSYTPSEIIDNSIGGTPINFPYEKGIGDLSDLDFTTGDGEMPCDMQKFENVRKRALTYTIIDTNLAEGPIRTAVLITNGYS